MPKKQKIAVEEKIRIIRKYLNGEMGVRAGAREAGVDVETFKTWMRIYENQGAEGFIWKGNVQYSAEEKTAAVIDYLRGKGSIQTICKKHNIAETSTLVSITT